MVNEYKVVCKLKTIKLRRHSRFIKFQHPFYIKYRQTNPTPDNDAANCLPLDTQMRNIRKVQVNAQVTFAIYILETVALASVVILWFAIRKNELSVTLAFVSFYVVLPYTFLMNTSHNKNLITEHGFLNTLRNAIQIPCNLQKRNVEEGDSLANWKDEKQKNNKLDDNAAPSKSHVKEMNVSFGDRLNYSSIQSPDIYIISRSDKDTKWEHCNDDDGFHSQHDPCPSHSSVEVTNQEEEEQQVPHQILFATRKENLPQRTSKYLCLAEKILENMLENVMNEDAYSYYLRELIRLEKANDEGSEALDQFEIIGINDLIAPRQGKMKRSKTKLKTEDVDGYIGKKICNISQYEEYQRNTSRTNFLGRFLDRLDLRKDMLRRYGAHCKDKESYRQLFDSILDLEEGLVM